MVTWNIWDQTDWRNYGAHTHLAISCDKFTCESFSSLYCLQRALVCASVVCDSTLCAETVFALWCVVLLHVCFESCGNMRRWRLLPSLCRWISYGGGLDSAPVCVRVCALCDDSHVCRAAAAAMAPTGLGTAQDGGRCWEFHSVCYVYEDYFNKVHITEKIMIIWGAECLSDDLINISYRCIRSLTSLITLGNMIRAEETKPLHIERHYSIVPFKAPPCSSSALEW